MANGLSGDGHRECLVRDHSLNSLFLREPSNSHREAGTAQEVGMQEGSTPLRVNVEHRSGNGPSGLPDLFGGDYRPDRLLRAGLSGSRLEGATFRDRRPPLNLTSTLRSRR